MAALVSDWFTRLSEPVRVKSRFPAQLGYFTRNSYFGGPDPHFIDWFQPFSEPVRCKQPLVPEGWFTKSAYFGGSDPHFIDWFEALAEPVRRKPPLGPAWIQFFAFGANRPDFSFALTEARDTIALSVAIYWPKQDAKVTITEIETYPSRVTIREIKYARGYS